MAHSPENPNPENIAELDALDASIKTELAGMSADKKMEILGGLKQKFFSYRKKFQKENGQYDDDADNKAHELFRVEDPHGRRMLSALRTWEAAAEEGRSARDISASVKSFDEETRLKRQEDNAVLEKEKQEFIRRRDEEKEKYTKAA